MKNIVLPLPPSVNALYGGGSKQRRFKTVAYKKWIKSCPELPVLNINEPIEIFYGIYYPDKRNRDLSNYIKAVDDYLVNSQVITDDCHTIITSFHVKFMGYDKKNPRIEIAIKKAPNGA